MSRGFSRVALAGFELFFRPWMRARIRAVRVTGLPADLPRELPLLLVGNHVSWWDGFIAREVHRLLRPRAPLHTVMLRRELVRFPFFRRIGGVGVDPDVPATVAHALRELRARRRERPDSVVAFFPQGRIWPSHRRPLGFQRGVELFARGLAPVVVLPAGLHLEPLHAPAPTAFVSLAPPLPLEDGAVDALDLEARVEAELDRVLAFVARHGEAAGDAWPDAHQALPPVAPPAVGAER